MPKKVKKKVAKRRSSAWPYTKEFKLPTRKESNMATGNSLKKVHFEMPENIFILFLLSISSNDRVTQKDKPKGMVPYVHTYICSYTQILCQVQIYIRTKEQSIIQKQPKLHKQNNCQKRKQCIAAWNKLDC